jgi:hypothetical protein
VNALIADTPPLAPEQPQGTPAGQVPPGSVGEGPAVAPARACSNCGQAMAPGQDWCLHCGAATPESSGPSGWRSAAVILAITLALVLGAAAAGVAALSKKSPAARLITTTVAQVPTTPVVTTPAVTTPTTPATTLAKPPTIPLKAVTPTPAASKPTTSTPTTTTPTASEKAAKEEGATGKSGGSSTTTEPEPILLDTNAAQTYNPYNYPASAFGDPSLTIDGDTSTGWSAEVSPTTAPRLAEGVVIDLKTAQKLSVLKLVTTTPGMAIQIYGANGATVPGSITDKAWVALSHQFTVKKRHAKVNLRNRKKAYRFVTVWISQAPESAVGTPEAPGHVTINEIELLPAG